MRNLFIKLKKRLHKHRHSKIIASCYTSFNWRDVIKECKCGERKLFKMNHDNVYPFPTTHGYDNLKEFSNLLKVNNHEQSIH